MQKIALSAALTLALVVPVMAQDEPEATATFMNAEGAELGAVTLIDDEQGVRLSGELTGIAPGEHGIHFHQTGDCDASTGFESAGGHFNPTGNRHGLENPEGPHAGDLPNIAVTEAGSINIELDTDMVSLAEDNPAYLFDDDGTALVIHAGPDDHMTDPSGNSGDRIACAVIEASTAP